LEILLVAFVLEQVDLCQQLFLLLLKLVDLFLEFSWIHAFNSHLVNILMCGLELSLEIFVSLEGLSHFIVSQEFVWDLKRHQEFGSVCSPLQFWKLGDNPEKKMLDGLLFTMNNIPLKVWIEVTWVPKDLQEPADSLLGLVLSLSLDIN
jgi:hypothetical protein